MRAMMLENYSTAFQKLLKNSTLDDSHLLLLSLSPSHDKYKEPYIFQSNQQGFLDGSVLSF
jgi:hypothetical protein